MKNFLEKILNFIKKHKKKVIIILAIIIIFTIFRTIQKSKSPKGPTISRSETTLLSKKDVVSSVNESGVVTAETSTKVFAEKPLPVKEVYKKVGDTVKEGEIIARLDDSSIRQQLAQKQAAISSTNNSAGVQIKSAKDKLNEARRNKQDGTNSSMQAANNSVVSSYDAWQSAEKSYLDLKKSIDEGYNDQLIASTSSKDGLNSSIKSAELNREQTLQKKSEARDKASEYDDKASDARRDVRRYEEEVNTAQDKVNKKQNDVTEKQAKFEAALNPKKVKRSKTSNEVTLNTNENNLITKSAIEENNDTVDTSTLKRDLEKAQKDLTYANRELSKAQKNLASAEADLAKYESSAESSRDSYDSIDKEIEQNNLALENAKSSLETSRLQDAASAKTRQDQLKTLRQSADSAHNSYLSALENAKLTEISIDDEIKALENNLQSANAGADNTMNAVDLKYLKEDLAQTIVKSPTSGTITELNADVGTAPTDAVAKVESVNKVQIQSHIKEFDVNKVKVGMKVEITSDALEKSDKFEGRVLSIEPTPEKKAQGANSNEVYYKTTIEVTSKDTTKLIPGMNVRSKYVLEENKNVFAVPSTAIYEKGNKKFVLGIKKSSTSSEIKEYEVKTGIENDIETIITGDNVREKLIIINSPENYSNGMEITVVDSEAIK